jgi:hypothetical protein
MSAKEIPSMLESLSLMSIPMPKSQKGLSNQKHPNQNPLNNKLPLLRRKSQNLPVSQIPLLLRRKLQSLNLRLKLHLHQLALLKESKPDRKCQDSDKQSLEDSKIRKTSMPF